MQLTLTVFKNITKTSTNLNEKHFLLKKLLQNTELQTFQYVIKQYHTKNSCDAINNLLTVQCKIVLGPGASEANVILDVHIAQHTFSEKLQE